MQGSFERPRAHRGKSGGYAGEFFAGSWARVTEDSPTSACVDVSRVNKIIARN